MPLWRSPSRQRWRVERHRGQRRTSRHASLAERVGELEPESAIPLFVDVANALAFAASRGVLHRDIKPANVLIDDDGAHVTDFGIAQAVNLRKLTDPAAMHPRDRDAWWNTAQVFEWAGTPAYMAPELFAGEPPSLASEIYSLGATLLEVAAGEHPFIDVGNGRIHTDLRADALAKISRQYGGEFVDLLTCMVDREPMKRPSSFDEVRDALESFGFSRSDESTPPQNAGEVPRAEDVKAVVARARALRAEGDIAAAEALLASEIERRGDDPMLLNALALTELAAGRDEFVARGYYLRALSVLRPLHGIWNGVMYLDSTVNLFLSYWKHREFEAARDVIEEAESWLVGAPEFDESRRWFAEFGWLYLVRGDFGKALSHIDAVYRSRVVRDEVGLYSMTLASWLEGSQHQWASLIAPRLLAAPTDSFWGAIAASLTGESLTNDTLRRELLGAVSTVNWHKLEKHLRANSVDPGLDPPISARTLAALLLTLDDRVTGGLYSDRWSID